MSESNQTNGTKGTNGVNGTNGTNGSNGLHADSAPSYMTCDVAIVGFGPVGTVLAALLAQRGLKVIAFEKYPNRYHLSRAGHIDGEVMRIFQRLGVATDLEMRSQTGLSYEFLTPDLVSIQKIVTGTSCSGWKQSYLCPSTQIEAIANARAVELGVRVYMGMTAEAYKEENGRAQLTVRPTNDTQGAPRTIDAAYVIGADGANSFMRDAIKSNRLDMGFTPWDNLVIDFEHHNPDRDFPTLKQNYQILDIKRPQLAGRWGGTRYSRFEFARIDGESREDLETESAAWKLLSKWDITPKDGKFVRRAIYTFESSMADKWRAGRAFLIGDAAHTMPPFMGQGMCSGFRDAMNLSWKLAAVIGHEADDALLDTYQLERGPHVKTYIQMSMMVGKIVLTTDPEEARRRDEMFRLGTAPSPPPFPRVMEGIVRPGPDASNVEGRPSLQARVAQHWQVNRLDEFLRPGWQIISRHQVPLDIFDTRQQNLIKVLKLEFAHVSRGVQPESDSFFDIDGEYDQWYESTGRKAFLQRPDNYVFGTAKTIEDIPTLLDELGNSLAKSGWRKLLY